MNHIIIILLGSNIFNILVDRIDTAFNMIEHSYINNTVENTNITWFLSGGIKNNNNGENFQLNSNYKIKSEASIMKSHIDLNIEKFNKNFKSNSIILNWFFVLDEISTNTAENFIMVSKYLNSTNITFNKIYVVTSKFHQKRANRILQLIDSNSSNKFHWVLSDLKLADSDYWENLHWDNISNDVAKAKQNFLYN